jgi:4-azaleucine resistance transporter AzlC
MNNASSSTFSGSVLRGAAQALPIVLGYLPVGFAYGVLAANAGLSTWNALLMSSIVYAGSAQLIAIGLFAAQASAPSILAMTFIVNLRHLLMSAALAPYLGTWSRRMLLAFGCELTDETFGLHASRLSDPGLDYAEDRTAIFVSNMTAHLAWICGGGLGLAASALIVDVRPIGLDYALPAMFLALLVAQCKSWRHALVAVVCAALSLGLYASGVRQWCALLAAAAGACVGVGAELWTKRG